MGSPLSSELLVLYRRLSAKRRRQLAVVTLLMPVTATAEMALVAAIVPFLALLADGVGAGRRLPLVQGLLEALRPLAQSNALVAAAMLFGVAVLATTVLRLALAWTSQQFAFGAGHELSVAIQRRLLHQPYPFHVGHHSSQLLTSLDKVDFLVFSLALQGIQAVSAVLIALFVIAALLWIDPLSAAMAATLVGGVYGVTAAVSRRRLSSHAEVIKAAYQERLKEAQDSLGAIRDIILDQAQEQRVERFRAIDARFMAARAESAFLVAAPRFLIESVGLILIALLAVAIAGRPGGFVTALPILGALALGAQRLLPLLSQIYSGWANLVAARPIVGELAELASLPIPEQGDRADPLPLTRSIELDGVSFRYPDRSHAALQEINFIVPKAARIAITGATGSGKSTLADLLMGLIEPSQGKILVDGVDLSGAKLASWRRSIAHVPQSIFLTDDSIAANIALNSENEPLDMDKVRWIAEIAQLTEFVESLPNGLETRIGERGARLSGGQRQRLAIARAIYKDAPVLMLDEATNALDDATEAALLKTLDALRAQGKTIIIIAHRGSTIEGCDFSLRLDHGRLVQDNVITPPATSAASDR